MRQAGGATASLARAEGALLGQLAESALATATVCLLVGLRVARRVVSGEAVGAEVVVARLHACGAPTRCVLRLEGHRAVVGQATHGGHRRCRPA